MPHDRLNEHMLAERQRLGLAAVDLYALRYRGVMALTQFLCGEETMSHSGDANKAMVRNHAGKARHITRAHQARKRPH